VAAGATLSTVGEESPDLQEVRVSEARRAAARGVEWVRRT
jgi:hypothetical protein